MLSVSFPGAISLPMSFAEPAGLPCPFRPPFPPSFESGSRNYRTSPQRKATPAAWRLLSPGHQLLMTRHGPLDILGMIGQEREYEGLLAHTVEVEVAADVKVRVLDLSRRCSSRPGTQSAAASHPGTSDPPLGRERGKCRPRHRKSARRRDFESCPTHSSRPGTPRCLLSYSAYPAAAPSSPPATAD